MAIKCGFFNAVNEDRRYTAEDMCRPYHRLVSNGVFAEKDGSPSIDLQVLANNNMAVTVKKGEGIFFDHWFQLDEDMLLNIDVADQNYARIDSIIVKIDTTVGVRAGSIEVLKGTPASNPVPPTLTRTTTIYMYRLANITIGANEANIGQGDIEDTRALSECGFITSLVLQPDLSSLFIQWQSQFNEWFADLIEAISALSQIIKYNSTYTSTTDGETVISIDIPEYVKDTDWLNVYINGLRLVPNVEYTIDDNETITLTTGIDAGTEVSFEVTRVLASN